MVPLYALTTLLGAGLLFAVQPMAAKAMLPSLGGSPAVWTTCLLFFQAVLLAGYGYAHLLSSRFSRQQQVLTHALVVAAPLALLPLRLATASGSGSPTLLLLRTFVIALGAPGLALAATGPLLQRWLAAARRGQDPTFLYAASNLGSLGALLVYPLLIEPRLGLPQQLSLMSAAYALFAVLVVACCVLRSRAIGAEPQAARVRVPRRQALRWTALAFVPSSAMAGTTLALTTDVAALPWLWVLPLAVYLVTFVIAFSARLRPWSRGARWVLPVGAVAVAVSGWLFVRPAPSLGLPLGLVTLFALGLVCHGRLAEERPAPEALTGYYLLIALGGVAGGLLNAVIAPALFDGVPEYPAALVLACLFVSGEGLERRWTPAMPMVLAALLLGAHFSLHSMENVSPLVRTRVLAAVAVLGCLVLIRHRKSFAAALAVVFFVAAWTGPTTARALLRERTFFGVLRVNRVEAFAFAPGPEGSTAIAAHQLMHGTTLHGVQLTEPRFAGIPGTYYHPSGPIGRVFAALRGQALLNEVGVIGLGVGTLASYGQTGQRFTFFEVDPAVTRIARDPALFTFLARARASVDVETGDGRVLLARAPERKFGLLVIDAFSSDAVPVHLLTREAVALYLSRLQPDGVLALHLSSDHFDLLAITAEVAAALNVQGLAWIDREMTPEQASVGKQPSRWAVLSRAPAQLAAIRHTAPWQALGSHRRPDAPPAWTDAHASLLWALH